MTSQLETSTADKSVVIPKLIVRPEGRCIFIQLNAYLLYSLALSSGT